MNSLHLDKISKKFGHQLIFSGITTDVTEGNHLAVIGYNGSGKSTLLQILAGYITPTSGTIKYKVNGEDIALDLIYRYISFSAPYLELIEEFTAAETISFYYKFKRLDSRVQAGEFLDIAMLDHAANKQVKFFSSGMKQRLKLTMALLSDVPFVLLDEPVSNLDKPGVGWYRDMVKRFADNKTLVISSNDLKDEMDFCNHILKIEDFKTAGMK